MTTNLRTGNILAALVLLGGLGACTTQAANGTGTGGTGTTGTGGSTSSGGTSGGGGSTSSSQVACGTGSLAPTPGVACPAVPASGLITDFTYMPGDAATPDTTQARFGDDATTFSGGESTYANSGGTITSDVTQGDWHITASVANYSGFNLYFDNVPVSGKACDMVDASAFTGISFTIWGSTSGNPITMGMGIVDDTPTPSWFSSVDAGTVTTPGSCIPSSGSQYYHPGCADPTYALTIPAAANALATAQTVKLKWTDFTGGACKPNVLPEQIVSIYWQFAWSATMAAYTADIHIDNLTFTTN